jgi:hypothetical protein
MAFLDDDFQGYSIGTNLPFGSFTGSAFLAQIVSEPTGTGITGTDRSLQVFLGTAEYVGSYHSSFTQFIAFNIGDFDGAQPFIAFTNGPNLSAQSFTLVQLRVEGDSTLTAECAASGEIIANSGDKFMKFYTWNFLQINVTLSDVLVAGVLMVHVDIEVALNGESILTGSKTTVVAVSQLDGSTSQVKRFQLLDGRYGAFTLDTLQAIVSYPHAGTPNAIVYQAVVEVDEVIDSGKLDIYQAVVEVDVLPDNAKLRVFQMVVEADTVRSARHAGSEYIHRRHFPGD